MGYGIKFCPKCEKYSMLVSVRKESDGFVEIWKCCTFDDEDKPCGFELPLIAEIRDGELIRK